MKLSRQHIRTRPELLTTSDPAVRSRGARWEQKKASNEDTSSSPGASSSNNNTGQKRTREEAQEQLEKESKVSKGKPEEENGARFKGDQHRVLLITTIFPSTYGAAIRKGF